MTTPFKSNGLALLIGINDYSTYVAATGSPPDAIHLKGGAHDTVAIERCSRDLGMLAENIRVLRNDIASPGNDGDVPSKIGEDGRPLLPTREEILRQIGWLRAELEGSEERHGLLWYSGHSAHTSKDGLLLCPSDTGKDFANAIPFKELGELLGPAAAKRLTVVLDCCHGGAINTTDGKRASTLGGDPIEPMAWIDDTDLRIGAVVLAACAPGELAQQSWFAGVPHGAFTWALLCVANQWTAKQQGSSTRMNLTYRQLIKGATALLSALDFEQTPQIWPQPAGALTVLQTGHQNESADDHPDANRGHIQLDPSNLDYCLYELTYGENILFARVLAVNTRVTIDRVEYAAGNEYWSIKSNPPQTGTATITITNRTKGGRYWDTTPALPDGFPIEGTNVVHTEASADWAPTPAGISAGYVDDTHSICMGWHEGLPMWFASSPSAGPHVVKSDDERVTLTRTTSLPTGVSWYRCRNTFGQ